MNNRKKNILIISFDFCLEAGGIQNTSYLLAKEFTKYVNVFTLCPKDGHKPDIPFVNSYQSNYASNDAEKKLYDNEAFEIAEKIHKEYHIDYILNLHCSFSQPSYLMKKQYKIPYGVMTYGNEVMMYPLHDILNHPRISLKQLLRRRRILNNATHIFSCANYTRELVKKICSNRNLYVIHPPISLEISVNNIINNGSKSLMILSIGRLVERKGYQHVIQSLPFVIKKYPQVLYVIAGTGEYEEELKREVARLNLGSCVQFLGRISEEKKSELLSRCGLFIMPSFIIKEKMAVEGFGLSLVEANLLGKFVISTKSGGIPEAVVEKQTGFLVNEKDVNGIADAIIRFYDDGFHYNPEICIDWAKRHQIVPITQQYWDVISKA